MINKAFEIIIKELTPFLELQKMSKQDSEDYVYANDSKAVKVSYDNERKIFNLEMADLEEGQEVSFKKYASFLFDEGHTEKDARAIGVDFDETLKDLFGIKVSALSSRSQVAIPKKNSSNTTPNVDALCGKFLSLYPQYKDLYKDDVAKYGAFLYEDFFTKTAAVKLNELANDSSAKKNYNKMLEFLDQYFVDGDLTVQSVITYSIVGEACVKNQDLFEKLEPKQKELAPHLYPSAKAMYDYRLKKG